MHVALQRLTVMRKEPIVLEVKRDRKMLAEILIGVETPVFFYDEPFELLRAGALYKAL